MCGRQRSREALSVIPMCGANVNHMRLALWGKSANFVAVMNRCAHLNQEIMKCKKLHLLVLTIAMMLSVSASAQITGNNPGQGNGASDTPARLALPTVSIYGQQLYYYLPKKSESLYAISKRFNINFEQLLRFNTSITGEAKKGQPVYFPVSNTKGDTLQVKPVERIDYMVQWGDTPLMVARKFTSTVADIFKANESIKDTAVLRPGELIVIPQNSAYALRQSTVSRETYSKGFRLVLVDSDESWEGVAALQNVDVTVLRAVNPGVDKLKKNTWLGIPEMAVREGRKMYIAYDERELTPEGQQAILMEIRPKKPDDIYATVVLAAPKSNRDIEFSRGFLTALSRMGKTAAKVHVNIVIAPDTIDNLLLMPELAEAQYIISTYEKDTPRELAAFAQTNGKKMIGVFDVRDTLHYEYPCVYQMLSTADEFHAIAEREIRNLYPDAYYLFVGDPLKAKDPLANGLMNNIGPNNFDIVNSLDDWSADAAYGRKLVIYSLADSKDEIKGALKEIERFRKENPMGAEAIVIGRPNWIAYIETMETSIRKAGVLVPSRFYFNPAAPASQEFLKAFRDLFPHNGAPLRSTPTFSVMGYDLANYLFGDGQQPMLQLQLQYVQVPNGGFYNGYFDMVDLNGGEIPGVIQ